MAQDQVGWRKVKRLAYCFAEFDQHFKKNVAFVSRSKPRITLFCFRRRPNLSYQVGYRPSKPLRSKPSKTPTLLICLLVAATHLQMLHLQLVQHYRLSWLLSVQTVKLHPSLKTPKRTCSLPNQIPRQTCKLEVVSMSEVRSAWMGKERANARAIMLRES